MYGNSLASRADGLNVGIDVDAHARSNPHHDAGLNCKCSNHVSVVADDVRVARWRPSAGDVAGDNGLGVQLE